MHDAHKKRILVLRQFLVGRGWGDALSSLEFARRHHVGTRKDGVTPEFDHQVEIALHAMTIPSVMHPEAVIAAIMLHDVREDYGVSDSELRGLFMDGEVRDLACRGIDRLTKEFRGVKRDEDELFAEMSRDPVASVVKPLDRVHNHQTMVGVFSAAKVADYLDETDRLILPMVKIAKRNFPHQTAAYENLKWTLRAQSSLIRAMTPEPEAALAPAP